MRRLGLDPEFRTALSIVAVTVGILICVHQRHFTLQLSNPASFVTMTHHRCGQVFLASFLWAMAAISHLCFRILTGADRIARTA